MDMMREKLKKQMVETGMLSGRDRVLCGLSGGADSVFLFLVLAELKAANEKLMKDNDGLKAALVRSAMTDPPREEPREETQEEKDEKIRQHAIERTNELLMKRYKE